MPLFLICTTAIRRHGINVCFIGIKHSCIFNVHFNGKNDKDIHVIDNQVNWLSFEIVRLAR